MSEYQYFATVYDRMMDNIPYEEWEQYILQLLFRYGPALQLLNLAAEQE